PVAPGPRWRWRAGRGREPRGSFPAGPAGIPHADANLADPAQAFDDQGAMAVVERLIPADEQRRRLLRVEHRPHLLRDLIDPVFGRAFGRNAHVEMFGRNEHPVGVLEATFADAV